MTRLLSAIALQAFFSWTTHPGRWCVSDDGAVVASLPQEWRVACGPGYATFDVAMSGTITRVERGTE